MTNGIDHGTATAGKTKPPKQVKTESKPPTTASPSSDPKIAAPK